MTNLVRLPMVLLLVGAMVTLLPNVIDTRAAAEGNDGVLVDYYDGLRAWDLGEKEIAVGMWQEAAKYGDRQSIHRLGEMYLAGDAVPADQLRAFYWFSVAEKLGDSASVALAAKAAEGVPVNILETYRRNAQDWKPVDIPGAEAVSTALTPPKRTIEDAVTAIDTDDSELLKQAIADVGATARTQDGVPLTFLALAAKRSNMLEYLLATINDPFIGANATMNDGTTLLDVAIAQNVPAFIDIVLEHGASAMLENASGATPDEIATKVGNADLAATLKDKFLSETTEFENWLINKGYLDAGDFADPVVRRNVMTMYQRAVGLPMSGNIDRASLRSLRLRPKLDTELPYRWILRYQSGNRLYYTSNIQSARSIAGVKGVVDQQCKAEHGKKCKFNYAPPGGCVAVGRPFAGEFQVSKVFSVQEEAEADALALCKAKSGGSCTLSDSWCVQ